MDIDNAVELGGDHQQRGLRPLRRKPKTLTDEPTLFEQGAGAAGVDPGAQERGRGATSGKVGGQGALATGHTGTTKSLDDLLENTAPDPEVAVIAQQIARRLTVRRRRPSRVQERGSGHQVSVPYRYRSDDIDLDRTLEAVAGTPYPADTDIIVRERMTTPRAVVLLVDVSGSMRGEKVTMAAATVAALTVDLEQDQLSVVAFWSDAALLSRFGSPEPAARVIDRLVRIPARGLTNVHFGLTVARAEMNRTSARRRSAVLLSDAVHNAGPDPRVVAASFPELHVLLQADGEHDAALGRDIARLGHGRFAAVRSSREIATALNRVLV